MSYFVVPQYPQAIVAEEDHVHHQRESLLFSPYPHYPHISSAESHPHSFISLKGNYINLSRFSTVTESFEQNLPYLIPHNRLLLHTTHWRRQGASHPSCGCQLLWNCGYR